MIALDDAALARLCIAAGRVPWEEREQWMERIAGKLEPSADARRARAYRRRAASGRVVLPIAVDHAAVVNAAIASGLITEAAALDKRNLAAALAEQLDVWSDDFK